MLGSSVKGRIMSTFKKNSSTQNSAKFDIAIRCFFFDGGLGRDRVDSKNDLKHILKHLIRGVGAN